jgi:hypothetical protein
MIFNWQDEIIINLVILATAVMLIIAKPPAPGDKTIAGLLLLAALCSLVISMMW